MRSASYLARRTSPSGPEEAACREAVGVVPNVDVGRAAFATGFVSVSHRGERSVSIRSRRTDSIEVFVPPVSE